jgi:thymidylate synthase ThyX
MSPDAQQEIRELAHAIFELIQPQLLIVVRTSLVLVILNSFEQMV